MKGQSLVPGEPLSATEEALIETTLCLTSRLNVEQTCSAALDATERMYRARSSWILLHDAGADELTGVAARGPAADVYAGARIPLARATLVGNVFRDREAVFVPDVKEETRWFDVARVLRSPVHSMLAVPLVCEDVAYGVLALDSPLFSTESIPGMSDLARLRAIAAQAAIGVRNARLFEAVEQDRVRLRRLVQERRQLRGEVGYLRDELRDSRARGAAVGASEAFQQVLAQVELVAPADSTVLLIGETGTGKELVARIIHERSRRGAQSFVAVNCAALPESLVESELFGYEKGAFTGAVTRKAGKFELADRGTILLDEIGDLPAQAQAKLLRVLQEREVLRVGGSRPISVNVRIIAATNRDLEACIRSGTFRPDLYYRLSVIPIHLPPLRERPEDIPELVTQFIRLFADRQHKPPPRLAPGVLEQLVEHDWPGNVRELQNVVERAVILSRDAVITPDLVTVNRRAAHASPTPPSAMPPLPDGPPAVARPSNVLPFFEAERRAIVRALEMTGWRISGHDGAANALGLKPTTLHAKMKKLGIHRPSVRSAAEVG
jgi:formate hydrogenlyase transcriptional activator